MLYVVACAARTATMLIRRTSCIRNAAPAGVPRCEERVGDGKMALLGIARRLRHITPFVFAGYDSRLSLRRHRLDRQHHRYHRLRFGGLPCLRVVQGPALMFAPV